MIYIMRFAVILIVITAIVYSLSVQSCHGQSQSCSTNNSLRLYNAWGNTTTQGGMLQICISSRWRAVCGYSFGCSTEGRIACRQLGYSGSQIRSIVMRNSAQYFGTWSYTDSYYYSCSSSSYSSLTNCTRHYTICGTFYGQVGLWCATMSSTECINGAVRLVGGQSSNEGILEYCYYGAWTQLCYVRTEVAVVACRQLGYTNPKAVTIYGRFEKVSNYSLIYSSYCSFISTIMNVSSCYLSASCGRRCIGNSVGIRCYGQGNCREGAVRLVNSTTEYEGRVEVCLDGVWGTVCGVGYSDATVICRTVGFDGALEYYSTNHMFGDGGRPIYYNLRCSGCESNIRACRKSSTYPYNYCSLGSVGGVRCHHDCTDGEVHLVGGSNETEGTVEVCHNKIWGMVSGLGWKERDARVTCRQLQFSEEGFHSYVDSPFGKPRRIVHFSAVRCVGNESRITDCPTTNLTYEHGKVLAEHLPVAGVACKQRYCECLLSTVELTTATSEYPATTCPSGTTEYQVKTVTVTQIATACPTWTVDLSPTQQAQPDSVTDNSHQTMTTIILAGLAAIFGTVSVTLAACLCYKIGKSNRHGGPQGQVDNQYNGNQPNEFNLNPNASYVKHANFPSYSERCQETVYEDISGLVDQ